MLPLLKIPCFLCLCVLSPACAFFPLSFDCLVHVCSVSRRTEGVQLMRHLILEVLKAHRYGNTIRGTIQPRVDRHLPVRVNSTLPVVS